MENPVEELKRLISQDSQIDVAESLGISPQYLSDVINERRAPGKKVLKALGLKLVKSYERIKKK
jgi:transcriptional regulator with XRE-family HTH domain